MVEMAKNLFGKVERERLPFVISNTPCKSAEIEVGKRLKNGINVVIMIKKMTIMQPTDRIDRVEFRTISLMSKGCFVKTIFACVFCFFNDRERKRSPFITAPRMWLANKMYPIFVL